ncbi:hypothetical protein [Paenibacillus thiaminolyticus]|uniref:Uncharacterized protein n=1 Tax=Paenibacillus thiaminolyticus TaxID=49283 RepID=A0A3A3G9T7_PANTH|nr:hypothetical protein [Paenibacillus thiaminolyticus]RJG17846.1 hypothetical protein DQX05_27355 [Paenibacillus thiaminolyticus]
MVKRLCDSSGKSFPGPWIESLEPLNFYDDRDRIRDYTAKVFNIHDTEKRIIDVTMHAFYDKAAQGRGEMLEDNYSMVYWEQRVDDELRKRYPRLYTQEDIETIAVTTVYSPMPIDSGTSPAVDDNGVRHPTGAEA